MEKLSDFKIEAIIRSCDFQQSEFWKDLKESVEVNEFVKYIQNKKIETEAEFRNYCHYFPENIKFCITKPILREIFFDEHKNLEKLSDKEKIAIYHCVQHTFKGSNFPETNEELEKWKETYISREITYTIDPTDCLFISLDKIQITAWGEKFKFEKKLFENERFKKLLQMILIFEIGQHCHRLATYRNVSYGRHAYFSESKAIYDRFVGVKILARLLCLFCNGKISEVHKRLLNFWYWPTINDYQELSLWGQEVKQSCHVLGIPKRYGSAQWVGYHYEPLCWNSDILNEISDITNTKRLASKDEDISTNYLSFFINGFCKKKFYLVNIHSQEQKFCNIDNFQKEQFEIMYSK